MQIINNTFNKQFEADKWSMINENWFGVEQKCNRWSWMLLVLMLVLDCCCTFVPTFWHSSWLTWCWLHPFCHHLPLHLGFGFHSQLCWGLSRKLNWTLTDTSRCSSMVLSCSVSMLLNSQQTFLDVVVPLVRHPNQEVTMMVSSVE